MNDRIMMMLKGIDSITIDKLSNNERWLIGNKIKEIERVARADQDKKLIEKLDKLSKISIHHVVNGNLLKQRLKDFEEGRRTNEKAWKREIKILIEELAKSEEAK